MEKSITIRSQYYKVLSIQDIVGYDDDKLWSYIISHDISTLLTLGFANKKLTYKYCFVKYIKRRYTWTVYNNLLK